MCLIFQTRMRGRIKEGLTRQISYCSTVFGGWTVIIGMALKEREIKRFPLAFPLSGFESGIALNWNEISFTFTFELSYSFSFTIKLSFTFTIRAIQVSVLFELVSLSQFNQVSLSFELVSLSQFNFHCSHKKFRFATFIFISDRKQTTTFTIPLLVSLSLQQKGFASDRKHHISICWSNRVCNHHGTSLVKC